jgi:hypothetical protein
MKESDQLLIDGDLPIEATQHKVAEAEAAMALPIR